MVCDQCARTIAGQYVTHTIPKTQMRLEALHAGWLIQGREVFCGPACQTTYRNEQQRREQEQWTS